MNLEDLKNRLDYFVKLINRLIEPIKELEGTDDFYKSKTFNSFSIIAIIIVCLNMILRLMLFIFNNDNASESVLANSLLLIILVSGLLLLGRSKYYFIGFYIFPLIPLLFIWSYYTQYVSDPLIELSIINPTTILVLGLIVGGLLLSIKEIIIFSFLTLVDLILFYGITTNFTVNWLIPRILTIFLVSSFMLIFTSFRILSFKFLNETNKNLSNEVTVKQNNLIEERKIFYSLVANLKEGIVIIDQNFNLISYNYILKYF